MAGQAEGRVICTHAVDRVARATPTPAGSNEDRYDAAMAFSASQLEDIADWCAASRELAPFRALARREFFGEDDPRPVKYWPGAGDPISRERRFVGWFMFDFHLPKGRSPAQLAATDLLRGDELADALDALGRTRFVLAIVVTSDGRRSTMLELEDERFEVRSTTWAQVMTRGSTVVSHLVPVRQRFWLPAPGWLEWPIGIGPNMRRELKNFQPDAIQVERLFQQRTSDASNTAPPAPPPPRDATLPDAVARMTAAANAAGRAELVMDVETWRDLVLHHMSGSDPNAFFHDIVGRLGNLGDIDELNQWLSLANNIWNATPQPDRGGRTPYELAAGWPKGSA